MQRTGHGNLCSSLVIKPPQNEPPGAGSRNSSIHCAVMLHLEYDQHEELE